jgi:hypothetical protein
MFFLTKITINWDSKLTKKWVQPDNLLRRCNAMPVMRSTNKETITRTKSSFQSCQMNQTGKEKSISINTCLDNCEIQGGRLYNTVGRAKHRWWGGLETSRFCSASVAHGPKESTTLSGMGTVTYKEKSASQNWIAIGQQTAIEIFATPMVSLWTRWWNDPSCGW